MKVIGWGRHSCPIIKTNFKSLEQTEILMTRILKAHKYEIEMWVKNAPSGIPLRKKINMPFRTPTGIVVRRGSVIVPKSGWK